MSSLDVMTGPSLTADADTGLEVEQDDPLVDITDPVRSGADKDSDNPHLNRTTCLAH